jgi:hypothetical protein
MVSREAKFDVAVIVPEMEAIYFQSQDVAKAIFGTKADKDFFERGVLQPKTTMVSSGIKPFELLEGNRAKLRNILSGTDLVKSLLNQIARLDG